MTDPDVSRRRERWRRQAQYLRDNGRLTSVPFRAAHHESAHAVASIYGLRETRAERGAELASPLVKCVWINRIAVVASRPEDGPCWTGGCRGPWIYMRENRLRPAGSRSELEWDLVATMAGSIAEALYCWYRGADAIEEFARHSGGGGLDFRRVDFLMGCLCEMSKRRRVLKPYVKRTIAFLEAHWAEVEALARALIEEKKIEGDRIAEIVDAATGRAFRHATAEDQQ
jgi:hypothetical protein